MHKILILGGGFGGIRCALDLEKKIGSKAEITLVDKNSYHLFVPALYEVASAYGLKQDPFAIRLKKTICIPYSDIFSAKKIRFIQAEIFSIDVENQKVATRGGEILDYDYMIIALGSQSSDFGVPGVKEYAFSFKSLENGLALNQKINELVFATQREGDVKSEPINPVVDFPTATKSPKEFRKIHYGVKIAVIGAGFTGIEVAAELTCCVKKFTQARGIKGRCERVLLIEAAPKILPMISDKERIVIMERLTRLGVEVTEGAAVEEVRSDYIKLKNGKTIDVDLVVWTTGVKPLDILKNLPSMSLAGNGKIVVDDSLKVAGLSNVFAAGDNVEFQDQKTGRLVPALAYVAVEQGKIAAKNILRSLKSDKLVSYNPFFDVWIAPVGGKYALAHLWGGVNVKGFWGWVIRELVDLKYMLSILPVKAAIALMWQEITLFIKND